MQCSSRQLREWFNKEMRVKQHWLRYGTIMLVIVLLIFSFGKPVLTEEMAPTMPKGTWIWLNDRTLEVGQVVLIRNPLDPQHLLLRRILALETQSIAFRNDNFQLSNHKIAQVDMHLWNEHSRVFKESIYLNHQPIEWGIIQANANSKWSMPKITIPPNHVFVVCDNRFACLDSRWWGPISIELIEGQVQYQLGQPWNENISFFQQFE